MAPKAAEKDAASQGTAEKGAASQGAADMVQMQAKMDRMQKQLSAALRNQKEEEEEEEEVRVSPEANQRALVSPEENVLAPPSAGGAVEPEVLGLHPKP